MRPTIRRVESNPRRHIILPTYLQITSARLKSADPPLFIVRVGPHATHATELELTGPQFFFLSIADGHRTGAELRQEVMAEFGERSCDDLEPWLEHLVERGVLTSIESASAAVAPARTDRYSRHKLFFASIGADAVECQVRLRDTSVAVVGVGGIGTWVAYLLAAAGVGHLRLVDPDIIEESNLTRQVLFAPKDIGKSKVIVAESRLREQNPDIRVDVSTAQIRGADDLTGAVGQVDLLILSANSPAQIHDWVDEYSIHRNIPWIRAGYAHSKVLCRPLFVPGLTGCLACATAGRHEGYLDELPFAAEINARHQVASFGPINGMAASMVAKEAIMWLARVDRAPATIGTLTVMDGISLQSEKRKFDRNPSCYRCGDHG